VLDSRASLFRLFGDEDRLRLLALCGEEELTVSELATLLTESQPQITKKSQPLREAGLLSARRDGTRTLLRTTAVTNVAWNSVETDSVFAAALSEGRTLCTRDGSLARIASVIAQREELSRKFFETPADVNAVAPSSPDSSWLPSLSMFAPLLPGRGLAIDLGTGDGSMLPILSVLFDRVVAVDRSQARLAQCASRIDHLGLTNVRLREGDAEDSDLAEEISQRGGADVVMMVRVLHHVARPELAVIAASRMIKRGGHLIVVDYLPHSDESMREQGDVWLGFEPARLRSCLETADLHVIHLGAAPALSNLPPHQLAVGRRAAIN
jgi:DNA-binding transcriptional ArsR family regulator